MIGGQLLRRAVGCLQRVTESTNEAESLDVVMAVNGQITRGEARQLLQLARETPPALDIVEIGTYRGRSTTALALGAGHGSRVYAVDPHVDFRGPLGGCFGPQDQAALYEQLARAGIGEIVAVVSLPSVQAARAWSGQTIGLLWIDGDHRYAAVRADVDAWLPFVVEGGVVAFHDTQTEDVRRVIEECVAADLLAVVGAVGDMAWFTKADER